MQTDVQCAHCRAKVPLGADAARRHADDPDLPLSCAACGRDFIAAPRPAVAKPPFKGLVGPNEEPAAPDFEPIAPPAPDEPAKRKPSLGERWRALSPRRQRFALSAGVVAIACGVFLWPMRADSLPPREEPKADAPPANVVIVPPGLSPAPEVTLRKFLLTSAKVPLNTLVTRDNVDKLFRQHEALYGPGDAVVSANEIVGKYVVADLNPDQVATRKAFAAEKVFIAAEPVAVAPAPREKRPTMTHQTRVVTGRGVRVVNYEFWEPDGWRIASETYTATP